MSGPDVLQDFAEDLERQAKCDASNARHESDSSTRARYEDTAGQAAGDARVVRALAQHARESADLPGPPPERWIVKRRGPAPYWRGPDENLWPPPAPGWAWSHHQRDAASFHSRERARDVWRAWLRQSVEPDDATPPPSSIVLTLLVPKIVVPLDAPVACLIRISGLTGTEFAKKAGVSRPTITGKKGDVYRGGGISLDIFVQRARSVGFQPVLTLTPITRGAGTSSNALDPPASRKQRERS
jgi:hypothetical protein